MDVPGTNQDKDHLTQKARVAVRDRIILQERVPGDDEQLVALLNDLLPEFPAFTVDEFRFVEDNRSTDLVTERWVAELDGAIVGTAGLFQMRMGYPVSSPSPTRSIEAGKDGASTACSMSICCGEPESMAPPASTPRCWTVIRTRSASPNAAVSVLPSMVSSSPVSTCGRRTSTAMREWRSDCAEKAL